jgi:nucleotide-binding universal stress UspA family protein
VSDSVAVCATERSAAVIGWAAAEARRGEQPLHVLRAAGADALVQASADAALLVVPAGLPELPAVLAAARCPVAAVPELCGAGGRGVVLGAATWTEDPVYEYAFRITEQRGSTLTAARVWHLGTVNLLDSARSARLRAWDRAYERSRDALDADLSAWRLAYPHVEVRTVLADDEPVAFLGALAARAELLVIGGAARFARLARLGPSASAILAASAACPVLVVPPGWPSPGGRHHRARPTRAAATALTPAR